MIQFTTHKNHVTRLVSAKNTRIPRRTEANQANCSSSHDPMRVPINVSHQNAPKIKCVPGRIHKTRKRTHSSSHNQRLQTASSIDNYIIVEYRSTIDRFIDHTGTNKLTERREKKNTNTQANTSQLNLSQSTQRDVVLGLTSHTSIFLTDQHHMYNIEKHPLCDEQGVCRGCWVIVVRLHAFLSIMRSRVLGTIRNPIPTILTPLRLCRRRHVYTCRRGGLLFVICTPFELLHIVICCFCLARAFERAQISRNISSIERSKTRPRAHCGFVLNYQYHYLRLHVRDVRSGAARSHSPMGSWR